MQNYDMPVMSRVAGVGVASGATACCRLVLPENAAPLFVTRTLWKTARNPSAEEVCVRRTADFIFVRSHTAASDGTDA